GVSLSQEDVNLKFLRSLPSEWKTHTLIWRNKADLKEQSLDDLFNSLKIYETEVKHSSSTGTTTQNLAFMSSSNTNNTTESASAAASVSAVYAKMPVSSLPNVDSLSNAIIYSFFASQSTSPQKGHFARECRSPNDSRRNGAAELQKRTIPVETSTSNALVSQCDGIGSYDWSYQAMKPLRFQPSGGYHAVPPPYIGTFMPPKPDLVFNTTPIAVETDHPAFNVQLSPTKPEQDLSHTTRPIAPIIEDWVSNSEDEFETKATQFVPSCVQSSEQVKSPRHSIQPVETSISAATLKPASPKTASSGKRRNKKACFVCKSVDHLIKDCDYHAKKMAQPIPRNYAHKGNHKQYALLTLTNLQNHMVPAAVLTQSKPVSITAVRPVSADVPKIKTSNLPPRVADVQALVVSAAQGIIDSGCSRHMTWNMSYLFDFEELNGGYVAFGGNPKGGKIFAKGKIKTGNMSYLTDYEEINGGCVAFGGNLKEGNITGK
nr:hypothetical protein [Tanacetum cinerariifolium]